MASNHPDLIYGESTSLLQAQAEDSLIQNGRIAPPLPETETDNVNEIVKVSCSENTDEDIGIVRSSTYKSFIGMVLAVLSGVLFTANNFILVHFKVSPIDATVVRGCVQCIILGIILRKQVWCIKIGIVMMQGIVGALGLTSALYSVTLMPVPDALTIIFTAPLSTYIIAIFILGERPTVVKVLSMTGLLAGVILVCKPSFLFPGNHDEVSEESSTVAIGIVLAILCSIFTGAANVIANFSKEVSSDIIVFWVAGAALCLASGLEFVVPGCLIFSPRIVEYSYIQWIVLIGLGLNSLLAYKAVVKSLQMISPTLVETLRSFEIVLAYLIQSIIDQAAPDTISMIGASLVCLGVTVSGLSEWFYHRLQTRNGYEAI